MDHQYNGCAKHSINWLTLEHGYECPLCTAPTISKEFIEQSLKSYNIDEDFDPMMLFDKATDYDEDHVLADGMDEYHFILSLVREFKRCLRRQRDGE